MQRECALCGVTKTVSRGFPVHGITAQCTHVCSICKLCIKKWVDAQLETANPPDIRCPECPTALAHNDVRQHAYPKTFARYDQLTTLAVLSTLPDFRPCISPSCTAGQLHPGGDEDPIFTCASCGYRACVVCESAWHPEQTHAENQATLPEQRRKDEKASALTLAKIGKNCPQCNRKIQKNGGCDHMTCTQCQHEFCWVCLADYELIFTQGNHHHAKGCPHHY